MSAKKKTPDTRRYGSFWTCPTCSNAEFEQSEMMAHLREVHDIDSKTTKGTRAMLSHLDGDTWFSWNYEWTIGDMKFFQSTCTKRSGASAWNHR